MYLRRARGKTRRLRGSAISEVCKQNADGNVPTLKQAFLAGAKGQMSAGEREPGNVGEGEQLRTPRGRMLGRMSDAVRTSS